MSRYVLFQMLGPFRESLIKNHQFYLDQASIRLLSQFDDIEGDSNKVSEDWLNKSNQHFDPDLHDPMDSYERAHDEGITHYQLLEDMCNQTRLSVISGFFHEWDKQLRDWMVREIQHWHKGTEIRDKVWSQDFGGITDLLTSLGWDIRNKPYYDVIDACRLVVNVYKHGEGASFEQLKQRYSCYIENPLNGLIEPINTNFLDYKHLKVTNTHIQEFSNAIVEFWNDIPENIFDDSGVGNLPKWFEKAWTKDNS